MAWNDTTIDRGRRTVLYERVDRPARTGAARIEVNVLMPYSLIEVDGITYIETNSSYSMAEGGGSHAIPSHGQLAGEELTSRALGVRSGDVPSGPTRTP